MATTSARVVGATASAPRVGNVSAKLILPGASRHSAFTGPNRPARGLSLSKLLFSLLFSVFGNQNQNQPSATSGDGPLDNDTGNHVKKAAQETREAGEGVGARVQEGTENARQEAGSMLNDAYNRAGETAEQTKHNTQNVAEKVKDTLGQRAEDVKGGAQNIGNQVADAAGTVKDKIFEGKDRAGEMLKDAGK